MSHQTPIEPLGDVSGITTPESDQKSPSQRTITQKSPLPIKCNGCNNRWSGVTACHCAGCHRTFTSLAAFDIHRIGGQCNDPTTQLDRSGDPRLVPVDKLYWSGWRLPGELPTELL